VVLKEPLPELLLIASANRYMLRNPIFNPEAVSTEISGVVVVAGITGVEVHAGYLQSTLP